MTCLDLDVDAGPVAFDVSTDTFTATATTFTIFIKNSGNDQPEPGSGRDVPEALTDPTPGLERRVCSRPSTGRSSPDTYEARKRISTRRDLAARADVRDRRAADLNGR